MIEGKYLSGKDDLSQIYELRREVLQQELGMPAELDLDGQDEWAVHAIARQGQMTAAVGRILFDGERYIISRVAVRGGLRRQGYGDFVVRLLINRALLAGARELYADALSAGGQALLEKIGFVPCGEPQESGGLHFVPMCLKKERLHKCCNHDTKI